MPLCGNAYKVSVTGFTFSVIWHDKHSADWLAALASPFPATPDFPRKRGQNKTPRNTLLINGSTVSTGYCATVEVLHRTSKWGEVRRLTCPLRRFPFAAPPNCGGGKGTGFIGEPRDPRANPVTCFPPGERWWRQPPKGESPSPTRAVVKVLS